MRQMSRRQFVRSLVGVTTLSIAANTLIACAGASQPSAPASGGTPALGTPGVKSSPTSAAQPASSQPTEAPAAPASPTTASVAESGPTAATAGAAEARPTPPPTPESLPDVVAVTGEKPAAITEAAVAALGGIERFVGAGKRVVIKPNICVAAPPEQGATTAPEIVAKLVELCLKAGASDVLVMDYGWSGQTLSYKMSGIEAAVKAAGGKMVPIDGRTGYVSTPIPKGKFLKEFDIFSEALTADVLINVPIAKNHEVTRVTLGMKNLMGLVRDRGTMHQNLGQSIPDVFTVLTPTLTLIDATRVMLRYGPAGGRPEYLVVKNTVVASVDTLAADIYAMRFFEDVKPGDIAHLVEAGKRGLGAADLSKLRIAELKA